MNFYDQLKKSSVASTAVLLLFGVSSCDLAKTSEKLKAENEVQVYDGGGEPLNYNAVVEAGEGCERGTFMIDVIHNVSGYKNPDVLYLSEGHGFITSAKIEDENALMVLAKKGKKSGSAVSFAQPSAKVAVDFFEQADGLDASEFVNQKIDLDDWRMSEVSGVSVKELGMSYVDETGLYQSSYEMNGGMSGMTGRFNASTQQKYATNPSENFGISSYRYALFNIPSIGYALYKVPPHVIDESKALNSAVPLKGKAGEDLTIEIANMHDLPVSDEVTAVLIGAHVTSSDKKTHINYLKLKDMDKLTLAGADLEKLGEGSHWLNIRREYLYPTEVTDEVGGHLCVMLGSSVFRKLIVSK